MTAKDNLLLLPQKELELKLKRFPKNDVIKIMMELMRYKKLVMDKNNRSYF